MLQLSNLDFNSTSKIVNLPDGINPQDPATLAQLQSLAAGLNFKDDARVSTVSNINLASPGATIDGITMVVNDRVLVIAQTLPKSNGPYIWNGAAVPMTRALDATTSNSLEQAIVTVGEGTNAGSTFRQTSINFILDTDDIVFTPFGTVAPPSTETSTGTVELATQAEVNTGTDAVRVITPATLASWTGKLLRYSTLIGDGSATQYTVTHNLGTRDLTTQIYRNSGAYDMIITDIEHTTINSVTVKFATAPTSNQFKIVILA